MHAAGLPRKHRQALRACVAVTPICKRSTRPVRGADEPFPALRPYPARQGRGHGGGLHGPHALASPQGEGKGVLARARSASGVGGRPVKTGGARSPAGRGGRRPAATARVTLPARAVVGGELATATV